MEVADKKYYLSKENYEKAVETLQMFSTLILFSFAKHSTAKQDIIIRNFIARGISILQGILALWNVDDYQDGWILYRSLTDRLFHIRALADDDAFELFDNWCFVKQYEQRNRIRSDPMFKQRLNLKFFQNSPKEKERYRELKKKEPKWKRPYPEDIAKRMGVEFLYKYGYDYASMHVHPMSDDGMSDFNRLTGLNEYQQIDQRVLLNNSCLVLSLLIQEGLNAGMLQWVRIVYDFLDHFRELLDSGSNKYMITLAKVSVLFRDKGICRKPE